MFVRVSDYYSNDVELLAWTKGIEKDGNSMVMAVSWTPDQASKYEVSTWVVARLENPVFLDTDNTGYFIAKE